MKAKRMKDNKEQNINEEEYKYGAYERKLERAEYKIKKKNKGLKIFLRVLIVIIVIILGIAIAGYSFVHSKLSKMKTEYIDKTAIGISEEAKDSLKGYRNIALLGIDSRADD